MNKIGLDIERVSAGMTNLLTINGGEWTKHVRDTRDMFALYEVSFDSDDMMFMTYSATGSYIVLGHKIQGRMDDGIFGWIFIPSNIEISGSEVVDLVKCVRSEISKDTLNKERLESVFSREYPPRVAVAQKASSSEKRYAKRRVGNSQQLAELLGPKRYQSYYADFNAILIEDANTMKINAPSVQDISNQPLQDIIVFLPPTEVPSGVKVYISDTGREFVEPVSVLMGQTVNLELRRSGFEPIKDRKEVTKNGQVYYLPIYLNWHVKVSRDMFGVLAEDSHESIKSQTKIFINNRLLQAGQDYYLPEQELIRADVRVEAPGFDSKQEVVNLTVVKNVAVTLRRSVQQNKWTVVLADGDKAEMYLKARKPLSVDESPLEGYSFDGRNLQYDNKGMKQLLLGFAGGVGVCLFIWMCVAIWGWFAARTFDFQWGWPPVTATVIGESAKVAEEEVVLDDSAANYGEVPNPDVKEASVNAIMYLENNEVWKQADLDSIPELKGLIDELQRHDFRALETRERSLVKSHKFKTLMSVIRENQSKVFDRKYNHDGGTAVNIELYIKHLKGELPNDASKPTPGSTGSSIADAVNNNPNASAPAISTTPKPANTPVKSGANKNVGKSGAQNSNNKNTEPPAATSAQKKTGERGAIK